MKRSASILSILLASAALPAGASAMAPAAMTLDVAAEVRMSPAIATRIEQGLVGLGALTLEQFKTQSPLRMAFFEVGPAFPDATFVEHIVPRGFVGSIGSGLSSHSPEGRSFEEARPDWGEAAFIEYNPVVGPSGPVAPDSVLVRPDVNVRDAFQRNRPNGQ